MQMIANYARFEPPPLHGTSVNLVRWWEGAGTQTSSGIKLGSVFDVVVGTSVRTDSLVCSLSNMSRFADHIGLPQKVASVTRVLVCFLLIFPSITGAGLYTASDQILVLTPQNVNSALINSTAAVVVEFYASWCGHCVHFSPVYKSLARDIKGSYCPRIG